LLKNTARAALVAQVL